MFDLDSLETFVMNREYEDIPQALPEDHGEIPPMPGVFDVVKEYVQQEVINSGGWASLL